MSESSNQEIVLAFMLVNDVKMPVLTDPLCPNP